MGKVPFETPPPECNIPAIPVRSSYPLIMLITWSYCIFLLLLTVGSSYQYIYRDYKDVWSFILVNNWTDDSDNESIAKVVSRSCWAQSSRRRVWTSIQPDVWTYFSHDPNNSLVEPCKHYYIRIFNRRLHGLNSTLPQLFLSGELHGNERLGPNAIMEFAIFLLQNRAYFDTTYCKN